MHTSARPGPRLRHSGPGSRSSGRDKGGHPYEKSHSRVWKCRDATPRVSLGASCTPLSPLGSRVEGTGCAPCGSDTLGPPEPSPLLNKHSGPFSDNLGPGPQDLRLMPSPFTPRVSNSVKGSTGSTYHRLRPSTVVPRTMSLVPSTP